MMKSIDSFDSIRRYLREQDFFYGNRISKLFQNWLRSKKRTIKREGVVSSKENVVSIQRREGPMKWVKPRDTIENHDK